MEDYPQVEGHYKRERIERPQLNMEDYPQVEGRYKRERIERPQS